MSVIEFSVNGALVQVAAPPIRRLADVLRDDLGLTGTKIGCNAGDCGACTVLVDGVSARGCLMLAVQADGCSVETVESLAGDAPGPSGLGPLQQAFRDRHALQCGFCTPGILMSLTELLRDDPAPDEHAVRLVLSGHLCRCTGYQNIVAAALQAASKASGGG